MHLTLEKTLGIALTLIIVASTGIPIAYKATSLFIHANEIEEINRFIEQVNNAVNNVISENITYLTVINVPDNVSMWAKNNMLYFKYTVDDMSNVKSYSYPYTVILFYSNFSGDYLLTVKLESTWLYLNFSVML